MIEAPQIAVPEGYLTILLKRVIIAHQHGGIRPLVELPAEFIRFISVKGEALNVLVISTRPPALPKNVVL